MPYAVVQETMDVPDIENLVRAFSEVPYLTDTDAKLQVHRTCGIISQRLSLDQAQKLQVALARYDIPAAIVDQDELMDLHPRKKLNRAMCQSSGFIARDALGRPQTIDWRHILVMAAGVIPSLQIKRDSKIVAVGGMGMGMSGGSVRFVAEVDIKKIRGQAHRLEIILDTEPWRYQVEAKRFIYDNVSNPTSDYIRRDKVENFKLLVRDMYRHAPHAVINAGVKAIIDGSEKSVVYRSKPLFERQIVWLIWRYSHPST